MKKWSLPLALLTLLSLAYVGYRANVPFPLLGLGNPTQGKTTVVVHSDYPVMSTLAELTQEAPIIAIGTIKGVADSGRNWARDPKDPQNPDPNLEITGVDYRFEVDRFLKGSAPSTIVVTEAKFMKDKGKQQPILYEEFMEMPLGGRYILFLRETDEPGHWTGIGEPWRYAVQGNKVSVESKRDGVQKKFAMMDANEFATQVEAHAGQR